MKWRKKDYGQINEWSKQHSATNWWERKKEPNHFIGGGLFASETKDKKKIDVHYDEWMTQIYCEEF